MPCSPCLLVILLAPGSSPANSEPRTYIRSERPITCSVSYATDLVTVELHAEEECDVQVWTGFTPQWALLDGKRVKTGWSCPGQDMVSLRAHAGALMWEFGIGRFPLRGPGPPIPVWVDGKKRGALRTTFSSHRLEARGEVEAPFALYRATLTEGSGALAVSRRPRLRIGGEQLAEWYEVLASTGRQGLRADSEALVNGKVTVHLTWQGDFRRPPIRKLLLETVARAAELQPADPPDLEAEGVILIEAEQFTRQGGGGPVEVSDGEHADQHGGASIYSFGDGEPWLEWEFEVPEEGHYALYARTATQEPFSLKALKVDRRLPFPEAELLRFPGTGGWAREDPKQWVHTIPAGADGRPPLELSAGRHKLRLETRGEQHLNVDFLALVPTK